MKDKIESLKNQVNSLQQKVIQLEAKFMTFEQNSKYALSEPFQPLESSKTIQQGNSTLEVKKGPYLPENDPKRSSAVLSEVRDSTSRGKDMESKSFSVETDKFPLRRPFQPLSGSQQYNISSNQEKAQNRLNFITLGRISEQEKIEIIQTGFQLNQEGKISLKNYYETTQEYSLFQLKGYNIKYETIRRTKLYQTLKE